MTLLHSFCQAFLSRKIFPVIAVCVLIICESSFAARFLGTRDGSLGLLPFFLTVLLVAAFITLLLLACFVTPSCIGLLLVSARLFTSFYFFDVRGRL